MFWLRLTKKHHEHRDLVIWVGGEMNQNRKKGPRQTWRHTEDQTKGGWLESAVGTMGRHQTQPLLVYD